MNKSEQLIACLEGEIAKRDGELAACRVAVENCELFLARIAELEAKTRTSMGVGSGSGNLFVYGNYDSIKAAQKIVIERDQIRAELAAIKAQEPVTNDESGLEAWAAGKFGVGGAFRGELCGNTDWALARLVWSAALAYAAPVSEAKAQGVVQWPDADEIMQMAFEEGQPADDASGYCFELEEFDLFIERLISEVARLNQSTVHQVGAPDGSTKMQWPEIVALVNEVLGCEAHKYPCERGSIGHEMTGVNFNSLARIIDRVRYAAAPAAPAADAWLVEALRKIMEAHRFNAAGMSVTEVHAICFDALAASRAKGVV